MVKSPRILPADLEGRLVEVLDASWRIFISGFLGGRHTIETEAPFQHHFANIIRTVGGLYCTERSELFLVDLETRHDGIKGKRKFVDITCCFQDTETSCAIELKFETAKQGAQDHGRIDAYVDIEALELACCEEGHTFGRFYMITDSTAYVNASQRGVGTVFAMHHGRAAESSRFLLIS